MQRRIFLRSAAALSAGALLLPREMLATQSCSTAVATPAGPVEQCTAGINTFAFQPALEQRAEWCWAASISMIFAYYGHPVAQARIVEEVWSTAAEMPSQPDRIMTDLNRTWKDDRGRLFRSEGEALAVATLNAVADLDQRHPLIIGAQGHATVLTALTGDTNLRTGAWQMVDAVVRDPWPRTGGVRTLSAQEWAGIGFAARVSVM